MNTDDFSLQELEVIRSRNAESVTLLEEMFPIASKASSPLVAVMASFLCASHATFMSSTPLDREDFLKLCGHYYDLRGKYEIEVRGGVTQGSC